MPDANINPIITPTLREKPHEPGASKPWTLFVNRRYGIWLFAFPRGYRDNRIWRENRAGYEIPTLFQRAVGITYTKGRHPRFPTSKGGYGAFGYTGPPRATATILRGFFEPGPMPRQRVSLRPGHRTLLASATGYAILWAPRLQLRSVSRSGAHFVGTVLVRERSTP